MTPLPDVPGRPARDALAAAGIDDLETLASRTEKEVRALHGMGPKAFGVLAQAVSDAGLTFRS